MSNPLAILTHQLGSFSETFIKRHIEDILPGRTVVVTKIKKDQYGGHWTVNVPTFIVENTEELRLRYRILRAVCKKLGWKSFEETEIRAIKEFLQNNGVRVALSEYLDQSLGWMSIAREIGIRFFAHAHGYDISRVLRDKKWCQRYLKLNDCDGIITMSNTSKQRLIELGLHQHKIHVIPYGVDLPEYRRKPENDVIRCVVVSRMVGKKGPVLLLDAFRRALKVHGNLHLDWVGEGELMPATIQFVQAFKLTDYVTFHGGQLNDFAQRLMSDSDIFVQHSVTDPVTGDEEGLPVAILEAMANGLPVVATRHAGIPEAVVDGLTGYLVEEGDTKEMAARLVEIARNSSLRNAMGGAGWQRIKDRFLWSRQSQDLLKVLGL